MVCVELLKYRIFTQPIPNFFQSIKLRQPKQGRDSCLKINKYYVIFEHLTIRHIPNSFSYEKPGTLMLKMNPSHNINIIIFFLSVFSYFFWIGNMFDEKHQKKGPPKIFSCLYQDSQTKINVIWSFLAFSISFGCKIYLMNFNWYVVYGKIGITSCF